MRINIAKGKKLPIGTRRKHGGREVVKTARGWRPVKGGQSGGPSGKPDRAKMKRDLLAKLKAEGAHKGVKRVSIKGTDVGLPAQTVHEHARDTGKKNEFGEPVRQYSTERQKLHREIITKATQGVSTVPKTQKPVAIVMMGGGGAGKGTLIRAVVDNHADFVHVDPDDVKGQLPEYREAMHVGNIEGVPVTAKDAAWMAHEESSDVANEVRKAAINNRQNIILDGTGKNAAKHAARIQDLKKQGYEVTLLYAHTDKDEAVKRAGARYDRTGRFVPDEVLIDAHSKIPGNFENVAAHADKVALYRTADKFGDPPIPILTSPPPQTHDEDQLREFTKLGKRLHAQLGIKLPPPVKQLIPDHLRKAGENDGKHPSVTSEELARRIQENWRKHFDPDLDGNVTQDSDDVLRRETEKMRRASKADAMKGWILLPEEYGASVYDELFKGAGHKYIKRVPYQKNGKTRYRYYYDVAHGNSIHHDKHLVAGAAFKHEGGHYHITRAGNGKVTIRHDETGETKTMTVAEFKHMMGSHHGYSEKDHHEKLVQDHADALKYGNARQQQVARERAEAAGAKLPSNTGKVSLELPLTLSGTDLFWTPKKASMRGYADGGSNVAQAAREHGRNISYVETTSDDGAIRGYLKFGDGHMIPASAGVYNQLSVKKNYKKPKPDNPTTTTKVRVSDPGWDRMPDDVEAFGVKVSASDISRDLATGAHRGTSHTPDKRGQQEVRDYVNHMASVAADLEAIAKRNPAKRAELEAGFAAYVEGYKKRNAARLAARGNVMSTLVTGPAKFPTARNRKRSDTADKRTNELVEWSKKTLKRIKNEALDTRISSDRDDAATALQAKIDAAEANQKRMKDANRVVRNKKLTDDQKVEKLKAVGFGDKAARSLLEPDFGGRVGFPAYMLSNNNANIKRMKERVEKVSLEQSRPHAEHEFDGGTVVDNADNNRVQIVYDSKPDKATIQTLKRHGFRWSRSEGAWQRQRNNASRHAVTQVLGHNPFTPTTDAKVEVADAKPSPQADKGRDQFGGSAPPPDRVTKPASASPPPKIAKVVDNPTQDNPVVIDDYPYGRDRTTARMYVEKNKRGDVRAVYQTQNPKTGAWNSPKKSNYMPGPIKVMVSEEGHHYWLERPSEYGDGAEVQIRGMGSKHDRHWKLNRGKVNKETGEQAPDDHGHHEYHHALHGKTVNERIAAAQTPEYKAKVAAARAEYQQERQAKADKAAAKRAKEASASDRKSMINAIAARLPKERKRGRGMNRTFYLGDMGRRIGLKGGYSWAGTEASKLTDEQIDKIHHYLHSERSGPNRNNEFEPQLGKAKAGDAKKGGWVYDATRTIPGDVHVNIMKGWLLLPEDYGARIYDDMFKGAGHKYIKRVPKKGGKGFLYFYKVQHGGSIHHDDHIVAGAAFKHEGGHYHVKAVKDGKVTVTHDETGETKTMSTADFKKFMGDHHGYSEKDHHAKLVQEHAEALKYGSGAQQARLRKRAEAFGVDVGPKLGMEMAHDDHQKAKERFAARQRAREERAAEDKGSGKLGEANDPSFEKREDAMKVRMRRRDMKRPTESLPAGSAMARARKVGLHAVENAARDLGIRGGLGNMSSKDFDAALEEAEKRAADKVRGSKTLQSKHKKGVEHHRKKFQQAGDNEAAMDHHDAMAGYHDEMHQAHTKEIRAKERAGLRGGGARAEDTAPWKAAEQHRKNAAEYLAEAKKHTPGGKISAADAFMARYNKKMAAKRQGANKGMSIFDDILASDRVAKSDLVQFHDEIMKASELDVAVVDAVIRDTMRWKAPRDGMSEGDCIKACTDDVLCTLAVGHKSKKGHDVIKAFVDEYGVDGLEQRVRTLWAARPKQQQGAEGDHNSPSPRPVYVGIPNTPEAMGLSVLAANGWSLGSRFGE